MGADKIIGVAVSSISKIGGTPIGNIASIGGQPVASFSNTYSLEFDGVDDYIDCSANASLQPTTAITLSTWFMIPSGSLHYGTDTVISQDHVPYGGLYNGYYLDVTIASNGYLYSIFGLGDGSSETKLIVNTNSGGTPPYVADTWYHFVGTWDGSDMVTYINGVALGTTAFTGPITYDATEETFIGRRGHGQSRYFVGNIDEVSIWNTALSGANVATLYNSGTPTDLSTALASTPVAWYRMGDSSNAYWNATNWLIPNNIKSSLFSQRSFAFDGVDDYVSIYDGASGSGPFQFTASDSFSFSAWIKTSSTAAQNQIISFRGTALLWWSTFSTSGNIRLKMYLRDDSSNVVSISSYNSASGWIAADTWTNVIFTRNASTNELNLYINGSAAQAAVTDTTSDDFTAYDKLSIANDNYSGGRYWFDGMIDDVSIWDSALSASDVSAIYNSGVPKDESATSNLVGYWKMGEGATFSTNWTVPDDSSNSSNGTSANMTETDMELNTPTNVISGTTQNMVEADRVTNVP